MKRRYIVRMLVTLTLLLLFSLPACSSSTMNSTEVQQQSASANLAKIMAHQNRIEGEITQPVDAQLYGQILEVADDGQEIWVLLKVQDFRQLSQGRASITLVLGSDASVRIHNKVGNENLNVGDLIIANVQIAKSREGPVIICRDFSNI